MQKKRLRAQQKRLALQLKRLTQHNRHTDSDTPDRISQGHFERSIHINTLASAALAEEKTTTRTLDQQLSKEAPVCRQLFASAEKMRNADRK